MNGLVNWAAIQEQCNILLTPNIMDLLERELMSEKWKGDVINIRGVTDRFFRHKFFQLL